MVDTARTKAQLMALLADNTTGDISAQDIRDVVESISDPVGASGFGMGGQYSGFYHNSGHSLNMSLGTNGVALLPIGDAWTQAQGTSPAHVDPQGWGSNSFALAGTDPESAWGIDVAAGEALMLPPGVYMMNSIAKYAGDIPTYQRDPYIWAGNYFDQGRWDPNAQLDGSPGWWYETYRSWMDQSWEPPLEVDAQEVQWAYSRLSFMNDTDAAQPFIYIAQVSNQPQNVVLDTYYAAIVRYA